MSTLHLRMSPLETPAMPGAVLVMSPDADPAVTEEWSVSWEAPSTIVPYAAKRATPDPDPEDEPEDEPTEDDGEDEDGDLDDDEAGEDDDFDDVDDDLIDLDDEWDEKDEDDRRDNPHRFYE